MNYEFQYGDRYGDILSVMIRSEKDGEVLMHGVGNYEMPMSEEQIRQAKEILIDWLSGQLKP